MPKYDPKILFITMDKLYDSMEEHADAVALLRSRFEDADLVNEGDQLLGKIHDVMTHMEDFLPSLEMEANGES